MPPRPPPAISARLQSPPRLSLSPSSRQSRSSSSSSSTPSGGGSSFLFDLLTPALRPRSLGDSIPGPSRVVRQRGARWAHTKAKAEQEDDWVPFGPDGLPPVRPRAQAQAGGQERRRVSWAQRSEDGPRTQSNVTSGLSRNGKEWRWEDPVAALGVDRGDRKGKGKGREDAPATAKATATSRDRDSGWPVESERPVSSQLEKKRVHPWLALPARDPATAISERLKDPPGPTSLILGPASAPSWISLPARAPPPSGKPASYGSGKPSSTPVSSLPPHHISLGHTLRQLNPPAPSLLRRQLDAIPLDRATGDVLARYSRRMRDGRTEMGVRDAMARARVGPLSWVRPARTVGKPGGAGRKQVEGWMASPDGVPLRDWFAAGSEEGAKEYGQVEARERDQLKEIMQSGNWQRRLRRWLSRRRVRLEREIKADCVEALENWPVATEETGKGSALISASTSIATATPSIAPEPDHVRRAIELLELSDKRTPSPKRAVPSSSRDPVKRPMEAWPPIDTLPELSTPQELLQWLHKGLLTGSSSTSFSSALDSMLALTAGPSHRTDPSRDHATATSALLLDVLHLHLCYASYPRSAELIKQFHAWIARRTPYLRSKGTGHDASTMHHAVLAILRSRVPPLLRLAAMRLELDQARTRGFAPKCETLRLVLRFCATFGDRSLGKLAYDEWWRVFERMSAKMQESQKGDVGKEGWEWGGARMQGRRMVAVDVGPPGRTNPRPPRLAAPSTSATREINLGRIGDLGDTASVSLRTAPPVKDITPPLPLDQIRFRFAHRGVVLARWFRLLRALERRGWVRRAAAGRGQAAETDMNEGDGEVTDGGEPERLAGGDASREAGLGRGLGHGNGAGGMTGDRAGWEWVPEREWRAKREREMVVLRESPGEAEGANAAAGGRGES